MWITYDWNGAPYQDRGAQKWVWGNPVGEYSDAELLRLQARLEKYLDFHRREEPRRRRSPEGQRRYAVWLSIVYGLLWDLQTVRDEIVRRRGAGIAALPARRERQAPPLQGVAGA